MNDPHVESLTYKVTFAETVNFNDAPPLDCEFSQMRLHLENGLLSIQPENHFESLDSARKRVELLLRSWEIDIALHYGQSEMTFTFMEGHLIDRAPSEGSSQTREGQVKMIGTSALNASATINRGKYPEPPTMFEVTPEVETLWNRYQGYLDGREPLTTMAYYCFTVFKNMNGSLDSFAMNYKVSNKILNTLSELSSIKGDDKTARKYTTIPLTAQEENWIKEAIKILIRRVGEFSHIARFPQITMSDLPPLKP